jgi:hypothetical protein
MDMHRLGTGVYSIAAGFGDRSRSARYCRVNPVAIEGGL